jgi:aldose 1-epimerase
LVVVMPECGGAIVGWAQDGQHVLRHTQPDAIMNGNVRGMACFPLVPFCNRIGNGRFSWDGVDYQLERNFGDHPHTIHGAGWQRPWEVVGTTTDDLVALQFRHEAKGEQARHWPFPFVASLTYICAFNLLTVTLRVENRHTAPAPLGIGLHPYFPRRQGMALQFEAGGVWINGDDSLPSQHTAIPREWNHANPIAVGRLRLDNCFTSWNRRARVTGGVRFEAGAAFRHLQVYTPAGHDYFCVEPVSHVPNALNRPDLPSGQGMHIAQPGEVLEGTMAIVAV